MDITQQFPLYLSPADLNKMYWKLLRNPHFVHKLDAFQKTELREYAEQIERTANEFARNAMLGSPAYQYPEAYRGNEFEYWMDTMSTGRESRQVLRLLAEKSVEAMAPAPQHTAKRSPDQLTVHELALLCVYTRKSITDENAKRYLEGKLTSGRALYNKFAYYSTQSNRTGFADETARVRKNMIARIQKVLPRLNDEQKQRAENDIHTLIAQNQ